MTLRVFTLHKLKRFAYTNMKFKLALYISVPILIVHFYLCDNLVVF